VVCQAQQTSPGTPLHGVAIGEFTGWARLNGANAVSFVVVKHVLENFDNFWQMNNSSFTHSEKHKN